MKTPKCIVCRKKLIEDFLNLKEQFVYKKGRKNKIICGSKECRKIFHRIYGYCYRRIK